MKSVWKIVLLSLVFASAASPVSAGEIPSVRIEAKRIVKRLASKSYWGRGYTKNGMGKAASFIEREIKRSGVTPLDGKNFKQPFQLPVNTFPGKMEVRLNDRLLVPGLDYVISPDAIGGVRRGRLFEKGETEFKTADESVTISLKDKLTWSVARTQGVKTVIAIDRNRVKDKPTHFEFDIESKFVKNFQAENIAAVVRGTRDPDRYVIYTAHYDHLGGMGDEAYFPGANDNASGVALLLSLARYYAAHPQAFSVGFIFFASEEAGLVGSKYFVEHPLIDLKKIRFLVNFDLVGTGDVGATVVNATEFPSEFESLQKINSEGSYLAKIKSRGKAPNSDHYWFSEHGVPAFFLYTMGGITAYHDVLDRSETLPMDKIDDVFALTIRFGEWLTAN